MVQWICVASFVTIDHLSFVFFTLPLTMKNNDSVYQQSSSVEGKRNNQARRESFLYNNQEMVKEEK